MPQVHFNTFYLLKRIITQLKKIKKEIPEPMLQEVVFFVDFFNELQELL